MTDNSAKASKESSPSGKEEKDAPQKGGPDDAAPAGSSGPARFDLLTIAVAAVLGAALALAVQFGLSAGGLWPAASVEGGINLAPLERRVTALENAGGGSSAEAPVAELRQSLNRLRDQVDRLAARDSGGAGVDISGLTRAVDDLESEFAALERRMATLEGRVPQDLSQRLAGFAEAVALAELEARVLQLEEDFEQNDTRRAAMGLGLAQLARAAQGSRPFAGELAAVSVLRPGDALVVRLAPFAEHGVPTLAMLQSDFPAVARRAARAAQTPEQLTAWGRVWTWLGQFVSFRRTGDTEGETASAILARADQRLDEGDLGAALDEMNDLPEAARVAAAEWIEAASARVALDDAITALSAQVIAELEQDR